MSSRADFYIKNGEELEWQGSIAWGGNEKSIPSSILQSSSDVEFSEALQRFLSSKTDSIIPPAKWPWVWNSSKLTEYSYILIPEKGSVFISRYNCPAYTIYQYRDFLKRQKLTKKDGKSIISLEEFMGKISTYTPKFPLMNNPLKKE